jgi:hypothetical protein
MAFAQAKEGVVDEHRPIHEGQVVVFDVWIPEADG